MTTEQVIAVLRRRLNEVDTSTSLLTDEELLAVISDVRDDLENASFTNFSDLAVGYDQTDGDTWGIQPDPSLVDGHLLAVGAAVKILRAVYFGKISRGELGVSWTSGLESESTISAAKAYRDAVDDMADEFEAKKLLKLAPDTGLRQQ